MDCPPTGDAPHATCPVEVTLGLIDGKWKGVVLFHLGDGTLRFNELRRRVRGATQRVLTRQLRELEADGLVIRTVYAEVPPRVEYSLTHFGQSLGPIIMAMREWGAEYMETVKDLKTQSLERVPAN